MAFSVSGLVSRRVGYGGVSKLIYGVSRSFSRMSPGLMLPPTPEESGDVVYDFFSLAENRVLSFKTCSVFGPTGVHNNLVGSSQGWLGLVNHDDQIALINPLAHRQIKLPSRVTPSSYLDYLCSSKVIISCSPDSDECRALLAYGDSYNTLAFCCPGRSEDTWTRIGGDGSQYHGSSSVYSTRQKLFFCARVEYYPDGSPDRVDLEAWDLRDPLSPKLVTRVDYPNLHCRPGSDNDCLRTDYFLVINDDTDDLFLVRRFINEKADECRSVRGYVDDRTYERFCVVRSLSLLDGTTEYNRFLMRRHYHSHHDHFHVEEDDDDSRPYKTIAFDVHRYHPESRSFTYIDPRGGSSLDGLSFFIDNYNGFALSSEEFPELKRNSIYFTVWCPPAWDDTNFGGYDLGIYNYQDGTISPCYYPSDSLSFRTMSPEPWWFVPTAD